MVADLVFDDRTLVANTADAYHNRHVMPQVTSFLTGGRLALSGAHGYMAFDVPTLSAVLPRVVAAWELTG